MDGWMDGWMGGWMDVCRMWPVVETVLTYMCVQYLSVSFMRDH